jgi:GTP pyrophosphokinase
MYTEIEHIYKYMENPTHEDKLLIKKAYDFGIAAHEGQKRNSGEPYFNHCIATAINIAKQKMDTETIVAGLLHDTLEDTHITHEVMIKEFGKDITNLVEGVSKLGKVKYQGVERHVESLRKFFIAMSSDMRVVVIKLCDRLHNISTLQHVREDKRYRIALETLEIHARLADRLGMGKLKAELEDGAFPYVYPKEYKKTMELLNQVKTTDEKNLEKISKNLEEELQILNVDIENVDRRIKHVYSLWQKLKKNDYDITKIYDIIAIRVIVPKISDCYQALGVVHSLYKPIPNRFKDYIANPKPNGYRSLHTTVFDGGGMTIEIQIRTHKMHEEAEFGIANHLHYKEIGDGRSKEELANSKMAWTKDLLEWQKDISRHKDFLKTLKEDFLESRVFVFTPKGDVIDLPEGSTPIDFAYSIHSDIGNKLSQCFVNGKAVKLDYKLKTDDVVKIETKENATPSYKWISLCKTNNAKKQISNWINDHGGVIDKMMFRIK